ncbi:MAG: MMPL family transporter [Deltaproteobacteria bacterium]|nr:MMPL family transporter [Deltaproteobacteria bacterium]
MTSGKHAAASIWRVRWLLAAILVPIVVLASLAARSVGVDNAVTIWFVEGDPALEDYEAFQDTFGNDEVVVLAVHDPNGVVSEEGLRRIDEVSQAAAAAEGVVEVVSLTTLDHVRVQEGWEPVEGIDEAPPMVIGPVVGDIPTSEAEEETLRARILEDPLVRGRLISDDGTTALVLARMGDFEGMDARRDGILFDLRQQIDERMETHVPEAGIGVIFSALNVASSRDMVVVGTAAYGVILLLLLLVFGRFAPVLLTIGVVGVAALMTMGLYGAFDRDMNMVTMALPTLVLIIGVADCVHMLNRISLQPVVERYERVRDGVGEVLWPCLFTSLTTAAGFLALATARMQVVRDLGWFAAAGVLIAFLVSVIGVVAGLQFGFFEPMPRVGRRIQRFVVGVGDWAMAHRRPVLGCSLLVLLAGAWGISRLDVDTYSIDYFYPSHVVRQDSVFIEDHFGPYTPLEFMVVAPNGLRNTEVLGAVARWQDAMEEDAEVGWTHSVSGMARRLNQVLTDGEPSSYEVPVDDVALEQALFLYEADPDAHLEDLVDAEWTRARVTVGLKMMSARNIGNAVDRLVALAELPEDVQLVPSGYLPLYVKMMDYVVLSQVSSFAVAFLVIFALLALLFRSLRMAVLAVPANLLPLFITLGLMGVVGIRLDVATVTIAAIVLGLVVDDTTHLLYRFREKLRETGDHEEAMRQTLRTTGVAMAITTLVLVLGFSVLGLAQVKSVAYFGLLSAVAMAAALASDIILMPALLVTLKPKL